MSRNSYLVDYVNRDVKNRLASMSDLLNRRSHTSAQDVDKFVASVMSSIKERRKQLAIGEGTYEMANIRPEKSGLPFIVYISEKGTSRHSARVKVARGARASEFTASVSVAPKVEVLAGELTSGELVALKRWIELNRDVILGYWEGSIPYTEDALAAIKALPSKNA